MKKFTLFLFFIGGLVLVQAQSSKSNNSINDVHRTLILKLGINLVDNSGDRNPFSALSDFDQMAFSDNYNIELEYRFSKWFSLAAALSNNKWKANKGNIDGIIVNKDQKYLAIDLALKLYYDEAFGWFDRNDWVELYLHGGVGSVKQAGNHETTLNFGSGVNFWISEQFGINFNGTAKIGFNQGNDLYNPNHIQYSASLMYRFIDNDADNDGVKNKVDDCPDVPGVAENNGCPEEVDSDGDGVVDIIDNCPNEYGTVNGCPETVVLMEVDSDGDSVLDSVDECPTVPGVESNNGCPLEEVMVGAKDLETNEVISDILFNRGNANFRQDSYPVLIKIIEAMKQNPEAQFKIEAHTSSSGSYADNMRLSQTRANAVRNYLISGGVPSENIVTEWFGETRPIASNLTEEGRRKNRRVEVIIIK